MQEHTIGDRIRKFAEERHGKSYGSVRALANDMGIIESALQKVIRNESKPGFNFLVALDRLGCGLRYLTGTDEHPDSHTNSDTEMLLILKAHNFTPERLRDSIAVLKQVSKLHNQLEFLPNE